MEIFVRIFFGILTKDLFANLCEDLRENLSKESSEEQKELLKTRGSSLTLQPPLTYQHTRP